MTHKRHNQNPTKEQRRQKREFDAMQPLLTASLADAFQRELQRLGPRASELSFFNVKNAEAARKQREDEDAQSIST